MLREKAGAGGAVRVVGKQKKWEAPFCNNFGLFSALLNRQVVGRSFFSCLLLEDANTVFHLVEMGIRILSLHQKGLVLDVDSPSLAKFLHLIRSPRRTTTESQKVEKGQIYLAAKISAVVEGRESLSCFHFAPLAA